MNEHDDKEIVDVLARDFPHVFNQILEYLDNNKLKIGNYKRFRVNFTTITVGYLAFTSVDKRSKNRGRV